MKTWLFYGILTICSIVFSKMVADKCHYIPLEENIAIDETCIQVCVGDKIYLNPDKIVSADHGLFLNLGDENYLFIPMIYSDASGYYITPVGSIYHKCPQCQKPYITNCRNPACPGEKNNKQNGYCE